MSNIRNIYNNNPIVALLFALPKKIHNGKYEKHRFYGSK